MQSILLVGEQRSGSNLLRIMLAGTGAIAAPHPPHVLQRIDPIVPVGGELDPQRFQLLVETVCRLVETNPVPWANTGLDRSEVARRCRAPHVIAIFAAVMEIHAAANGAPAWMCKSMQNIRWAPALDGYLRRNRYVYLHRDPRDVALSFTKAVVGDKHVYFLAKQWAELQRLCLDTSARLGPERFHPVSYRELTESPEATLRRLCDFLGIEFSPRMLECHDSEEARNTAAASSLWENVKRPIIATNHDKFREELADEEVRIVESVAGREMDELGYARVLVERGQEDTFTADRIAGFKKINERLKKLRAQTMEPEDAERRKRQDQVLVDLRARLAELQTVSAART
ncbi:MAG: sulfotransferase [Planctomycetota bacterium]|nr:sulfotransferase [Planctomycetota bacterium]